MDSQQPIIEGSITNNYLLPPIIPEKELEYIKKRGAYIDNILKSIDLSKLDIQIPVLNKIILKQPVTNNTTKFHKTRKRNSAIKLSAADP